MVPIWINLFELQNLLPSYSKNRHIKPRISSLHRALLILGWEGRMTQAAPQVLALFFYYAQLLIQLIIETNNIPLPCAAIATI